MPKKKGGSSNSRRLVPIKKKMYKPAALPKPKKATKVTKTTTKVKRSSK